MGKVRLIVDLDNTLLFTRNLVKAAVSEIAPWGATFEDYLSADASNRLEAKNQHYSLYRHLKKLAQKNGVVDFNEIKRMEYEFLDFIANNSSRFLFKDAIYFLESFYRITDIVLLTYGLPEFQKYKLQGLEDGGMGIYFKKMIVTTRSKIEVIDSFCREQDECINFFIDDSIAQLYPVAKRRPDIVTVWLDRKRPSKIGTKEIADRRCREFDYVVEDLYQADKILAETI